MASRDFIDRFRQHGYFTVRSLLSLAEVEAIRQEITQIAEKYPDTPAELIQFEVAVQEGSFQPSSTEMGIRKLFRMAKHNQLFQELAFHPRLLEIAGALLGQDLILMQSMLLMKPPTCSTRKIWHQDNAYFRLSPCDVFGFWIACDTATVENGCMHVLPGSHANGIVEHAGEGDEYGWTGSPDANAIVPVPLEPGDALIFHGELLHFTPANQTNQRRRAVQYHYASQSCAQAPAKEGDYPVDLQPELEMTA